MEYPFLLVVLFQEFSLFFTPLKDSLQVSQASIVLQWLVISVLVNESNQLFWSL